MWDGRYCSSRFALQNWTRRAKATEDPSGPTLSACCARTSDSSSLERQHRQTVSCPPLVCFLGARCSLATRSERESTWDGTVANRRPISVLNNPALLHMIHKTSNTHTMARFPPGKRALGHWEMDLTGLRGLEVSNERRWEEIPETAGRSSNHLEYTQMMDRINVRVEAATR